MFYPGNPSFMIYQLINGSSFVVRFTPYSDNQRTITFSLMGLTNAVASNLSDYHGWIESVESSFQNALQQDQADRERFLTASIQADDFSEGAEETWIAIGDTISIRSTAYLVLDIDHRDDRIKIEPLDGNSHSGTNWISLDYSGIEHPELEYEDTPPEITYEHTGTLNTSILLLDGEIYIIREISEISNLVLLYPQDDSNYSGPSEGTWVGISYEGIELIYE